jgi:hypothetical protein
MSTTRVNAAELERLRDEVTERDLAVLRSLELLHLATGQMLLRLHWPSASDADARAARRTLKRLVDWRLVARLERRLGGLGRGSDSYTYALDVAGQRLLHLGGTPRRPHLPGQPMWRHVLLVSEVYTRLVEGTRGTERSLTVWQSEPSSWRRYGGAYNEPLVLKPDAFAQIEGGGYADVSFVEADTGSQSTSVIRAKAEAYRRYSSTGIEQAAQGGVFPRVVFVTTTDARRQRLVDVLGTQPAEAWRLFRVGTVDETAALLDPEVTP